MLKTACWLNPPGALATKDLAGRSVYQAPGSLGLELCHGLPHDEHQPASSGGDHLHGLKRDTLVYTAIIGVGRALVKIHKSALKHSRRIQPAGRWLSRIERRAEQRRSQRETRIGAPKTNPMLKL